MLAFRAATRTAIPSLRMPVARPMMMAGRRFASTNELNNQALPFTYGASPQVRYTEDHEWIALHNDGTAFVGITKYAADALGDATFVEVPEAGEVSQGDSIGSVESVKSASELYAPYDAEVIEGNKDLESDPALVNSDPLGKAWFSKLKFANPDELEELMNLEKYEEFVKSE